MFNIFLISQTFSWLLRSMLGISFINSTSGSTSFKTETCLILIIVMLSGRSNLYVINPRIFEILKGSNLVKFNLLLSCVVRINIIFVLSICYRRYTLFFFLRVGPLTFFLSANFFIFLFKKIRFCRSSSCNSWISFTVITICGTSSLHFLIFIEMSASNFLFMKNGVLLVVLYSDVLYASISMGNSLTQLVY